MSQNSRPALNSSTSRRNYLLGIIHGTCLRLGMNLTDPSLVLSVFVRMLGGSNMLIGLLPTIRFGGWFLPQFLAASWIQPQEPHARVMGGYDQLWDGPSLSLIS